MVFVTDLLALPTYAATDAFHVVIESPRGSTSKFKYDPARKVMTLSRPLTNGLSYPYDWGFVPSTRAADGDPLDAIVMWDGTSYPGVVIPCRPIGVLRVEQTNPTARTRERNDRLAALPTKAPRWDSVRSVSDLGERIRQEIEQFFLTAVAFEGKELAILGWGDPGDAMALVRASRLARGRSSVAGPPTGGRSSNGRAIRRASRRPHRG
jgi:inorganic pyrophosphatase